MASSQHTSRLLAGKYRYRLIQQPGDKTRPITQKIRSAIFDVIGQDVSGLRVADLYAGSGALALEALSRGAASAIAVESRPRAVQIIRANATSLGANLEVEPEKVELWLKDQDVSYDIIFFDPPYDQFSVEVAGLAASHLASQGVLVISCSARQVLPDNLGVASIAKSRTYGDTQIGYYIRG